MIKEFFLWLVLNSSQMPLQMGQENFSQWNAFSCFEQYFLISLSFENIFLKSDIVRYLSGFCIVCTQNQPAGETKRACLDDRLAKKYDKCRISSFGRREVYLMRLLGVYFTNKNRRKWNRLSVQTMSHVLNYVVWNYKLKK